MVLKENTVVKSREEKRREDDSATLDLNKLSEMNVVSPAFLFLNSTALRSVSLVSHLDRLLKDISKSYI